MFRKNTSWFENLSVRWRQRPYCQCPCWQQQTEGHEAARPPAPHTPSTSAGPPPHLSWRSCRSNFVSKPARRRSIIKSAFTSCLFICSTTAAEVTSDTQRCSWRLWSTLRSEVWRGRPSLSSSLSVGWWSRRSASEARCWWRSSSAAHARRGSTECLHGKQCKSCTNKMKDCRLRLEYESGIELYLWLTLWLPCWYTSSGAWLKPGCHHSSWWPFCYCGLFRRICCAKHRRPCGGPQL